MVRTRVLTALSLLCLVVWLAGCGGGGAGGSSSGGGTVSAGGVTATSAGGALKVVTSASLAGGYGPTFFAIYGGNILALQSASAINAVGDILYASGTVTPHNIKSVNSAIGPTSVRTLVSNGYDKRFPCYCEGAANQLAFGQTVGLNFEIFTSRLTWNGTGAGGLNLTNLTNYGSGTTVIGGYYPAIAPYGSSSYIVFESNRTGTDQLYQIPTGGGTATRLTNDTWNDVDPDVNADGDIVWASNQHGNYNLEVQDSSGQYYVTSGTNHDEVPAWSPDGTQIAFSRLFGSYWEIWKINADGSNLTQLTNSSAINTHPTWSPDGTQIAFQSNLSGVNHIYKVPAAGGSAVAITAATTDDIDPHWIWDDHMGTPRTFLGGGTTADEGYPAPFGSTALQVVVGGPGMLGLRCGGTASAVTVGPITGGVGTISPTAGVQIHTPAAITYMAQDMGPGNAPLILIAPSGTALFVSSVYNNVMVFIANGNPVAILPWDGPAGVTVASVGARTTGAPVISTSGNTVTVTGKVLRLSDHSFCAGLVSDAKTGAILNWK